MPLHGKVSVTNTGCPKVECAFWKCYCSKTVKHIDLNWCFLNSQHYDIWYSNLTFAKKKREMKKISIWKKILIFFWSKFFFKIFSKIFFALNQPKKRFKAKFFFQKISKKYLWYKFFIVFKLKFFVFPFSFLQRLGLNIKWWTLVRILVYHLIQFSSFLYLFQRF